MLKYSITEPCLKRDERFSIGTLPAQRHLWIFIYFTHKNLNKPQLGRALRLFIMLAAYCQSFDSDSTL